MICSVHSVVLALVSVLPAGYCFVAIADFVL